jgi:hypothetical protein
MTFNELYIKLRDFSEELNEQQHKYKVRLGVKFPDGTLRFAELDDVSPVLAVHTGIKGVEKDGGVPFILLNPSTCDSPDIPIFDPDDSPVCSMLVGIGIAKSAFMTAYENHIEKFMDADSPNVKQEQLDMIVLEAKTACKEVIEKLKSSGRKAEFASQVGNAATDWIREVANTTLQPLVNKARKAKK